MREHSFSVAEYKNTYPYLVEFDGREDAIDHDAYAKDNKIEYKYKSKQEIQEREYRETKHRGFMWR